MQGDWWWTFSPVSLYAYTFGLFAHWWESKCHLCIIYHISNFNAGGERKQSQMLNHRCHYVTHLVLLHEAYNLTQRMKRGKEWLFELPDGSEEREQGVEKRNQGFFWMNLLHVTIIIQYGTDTGLKALRQGYVMQWVIFLLFCTQFKQNGSKASQEWESSDYSSFSLFSCFIFHLLLFPPFLSFLSSSLLSLPLFFPFSPFLLFFPLLSPPSPHLSSFSFFSLPSFSVSLFFPPSLLFCFPWFSENSWLK